MRFGFLAPAFYFAAIGCGEGTIGDANGPLVGAANDGATSVVGSGAFGDGGAAAGGTGNGLGSGTSSSSSDTPGTGGTPTPVDSHPRLWFTADDLPALRARANASNSLFQEGLMVAVGKGVELMDQGEIPNDDDCIDSSANHTCEEYAELFAFMSLVSDDQSTRDAYAARARTLLMAIIDRAKLGPADGDPIRDPEFSIRNRSRWFGEAFPLTVDWIYPYLSSVDKASIRTTFLRWSEEQLTAEVTGYNHPEPVGVADSASVVSDKGHVRWSGNNYFAAHARNLGLMSLALDDADDDGGALRAYFKNASGAWLYLIDDLLRNDARGGLGPEGYEYGAQATGAVAQLLLAIQTAGFGDSSLYGPQVMFSNADFWTEAPKAQFHLTSPVSVPSDYPGAYYEPVAFGDSDSYAPDGPTAGDFVELFGPVGLHAKRTGDTKTLNSIRWLQMNMPPGGKDRFELRASAMALHAILYFALFDSTEGAADPRLELPLDHFAPGTGIYSARTGWDESARWFYFKLGWSTIDHQHGDGNSFGLYRKGEWLTKELTGWDIDPFAMSDCHNTLSIENDMPGHTDGYRGTIWQTGSQYLYDTTGDGVIVARSSGDGYAYLVGDATGLYNDAYELVSDVQHASRSILWIKPDHVVTYDRAVTGSPNHFKRLWLVVPSMPSISGKRATATTAGGQKVTFTLASPAQATLAGVALPAGDAAVGDPMKARLRVEAQAGAEARFFGVVQGMDGSASPDSVTLLTSSVNVEAAAIRDTVVVFPKSISEALSSVQVTAPQTANKVFATGFSPGQGYTIVSTPAGSNVQISIELGGTTIADAGGMLTW